MINWFIKVNAHYAVACWEDFMNYNFETVIGSLTTRYKDKHKLKVHSLPVEINSEREYWILFAFRMSLHFIQSPPPQKSSIPDSRRVQRAIATQPPVGQSEKSIVHSRLSIDAPLRPLDRRRHLASTSTKESDGCER